MKNLPISELDAPDHSQADNFESIVDLFTLLSLVLIIATFIYGYPRGEKTAPTPQTVSEYRVVQEGDTPPLGVPENTVILIQSVEENRDTITLIVGGKESTIIYYSGQDDSLWSVLAENKMIFVDATDIQVVVNNRENSVDPNLFLLIQRWLAHNSLKATVYFAEDIV